MSLPGPRRTTLWRCVLFGLVVSVALPVRHASSEQSRGEAGATDVEAIRATMRSLLGDIQTLLRGSLREQWIATAGETDAIEAAIDNIEGRSFALTGHAPQMDMEYLTAVLDRYAWWLRIAYREGDREAFDVILGETIDACIACHTRLPSGQDPPTAEAFVASELVRELPVSKKYPLLIATRRFGDALNLLEETFVRPFAHWPPARPALRRYVLTSMRVKHDLRRAAQVLDALAPREDVPPELRRLAGAWASDLRREADSTFGGGAKQLAAARERVERAENDPKDETELLVQYALASALLHDYVTTPGLSATARSEAAYLLGLCYHRMAGNESLPQSDFYLEYSILADPASRWAEDAFALLARIIEKSYTDAGEHVPEGVEALLNELEQLLPD